MTYFHKVFYSLRDINFRIYFITRSLSLLGFSVQNVAFLWLIYDLTNSALLVGLAAIIRQACNFFMSPVSGVLADRLPKKKFLFYAQLLRLIVLGTLAMLIFQERHTAALLFTGQLLIGLLNGVEMPVRQSLLFALAGKKENINNIIALNSTSINIGKIGGPFLAAISIPLLGEAFCYLVYAAFTVFFMIGLSYMEIKELAIKGSRPSFVGEYLEGFRIAARNHEIKRTLIQAFIAAFFGFSFLSVLSYIAGEGYDNGASVLGFMHTLLGIGSLIGTLVIAGSSSEHTLQRIRSMSLLLYPVCIFLFAYSSVLAIQYLLLFITGFMQMGIFTTSKTFTQLQAEDHNVGKISGVYIAVLMGAVTIGSGAVGLLSDYFAAHHVIMSFSIIGFLMLTAFRLREIRTRQAITPKPATF